MGRINVLVFVLLTGWWNHLFGEQLGQVIARDPVMIHSHERYYVFAIGNGISVWSSSDMKSWKSELPVLKH